MPRRSGKGGANVTLRRGLGQRTIEACPAALPLAAGTAAVRASDALHQAEPKLHAVVPRFGVTGQR